MNLIQSKDGYNVEINPELYTIHEFAELLESRKDKKLLLKEIAYIYFFYDLSSDFQFELNTMARHDDVVRYVNLPGTWSKDKYMDNAIAAFLYLSQTPASKLLQAAYIGANKLKEQLEQLDLNERDKAGRPIWNLKQYNDTLKSLADTVDSIDKAERQFIKSQEDNSTLRGTKIKSIYEDGFRKK